MLGNIRIGTKLMGAMMIVPLLVGVIGWWALGVVSGRGVTVSSEYAPHVDAMMEVKLAVTDAHLNLEELMGGDDTRSIADVHTRFASARWYLNAILEGGRNDEGSYVRSTDDTLRAAVARTQTALESLLAAADDRYANRASGTTGVGTDADQAFDAAFERFLEDADRAESRAQGLLNQGIEGVRAQQDRARLSLGGGIVAALALGVFFAIFMARHLADPLVDAAGRSGRMADGDLAIAADRTGDARGDEVGQLLRNFHKMHVGLRDAMQSIQAGARDLAAQSQEVGSTASEYAATVAEQSRAVQEASATVEQLRQLSEASLHFAREVVQSSEHAAERGHRGIQAIGSAVDTMEVLGARVEAIAQTIRDLSERSRRIREVVDTVNELAEQSNLLAVNASIEAAQAGEHGRGFGVVAGEVRNLATQSKRAAQQIRGLVAEIEHATAEAVTATREGSARAIEGKTTMRSVREVVDELASTLEGSSERARKIAGSAAEQAQATTQVAAALRDISESGRMQVGGVTSLENAASKLSRLGDSQKVLTDRYRF